MLLSRFRGTAENGSYFLFFLNLSAGLARIFRTDIQMSPAESEMSSLARQDGFQIYPPISELFSTTEEVCAALYPVVSLYARGNVPAAISSKAGESDLVQEALLGISQGWRNFRGQTEGELCAWVKGVVRNKLLELQRKYGGVESRDVRRECSLDEAMSVGTGGLASGSSLAPLEKLVTAEEVARVQALLPQLHQIYQQVLDMRWRLELTFQQIAIELGRTEASVRHIHSRAIDLLRERMKSSRA